MEKKMTYAQALEIAIASVEGEAKERLEALKASLEKKASKKASVDNTPYFDKIREALADGAKTPTELVNLIDDIPNTQKIASVIKAMGDEVVKNTKGKKVTYELA